MSCYFKFDITLYKFSNSTYGNSVLSSIKFSFKNCVCFIVFLYYVCRLCINFQDLCTSLLGDTCMNSASHLHFTLCD